MGLEGLVSHGLQGKVAFAPAVMSGARASPSRVWAGLNRWFLLHCFGFMHSTSSWMLYLSLRRWVLLFAGMRHLGISTCFMGLYTWSILLKMLAVSAHVLSNCCSPKTSQSSHIWPLRFANLNCPLPVKLYILIVQRWWTCCGNCCLVVYGIYYAADLDHAGSFWPSVYESLQKHALPSALSSRWPGRWRAEMCCFTKSPAGARDFKQQVGGRKMCEKSETKWAETLCWKDMQDEDWEEWGL